MPRDLGKLHAYDSRPWAWTREQVIGNVLGSTFAEPLYQTIWQHACLFHPQPTLGSSKFFRRAVAVVAFSSGSLSMKNMDAEQEKKKDTESSDEDRAPPPKALKKEAIQHAVSQEVVQSTSSSGYKGKELQKRREQKAASAAAGEELAVLYEKTRGKSKNKEGMKELLEARKKIEKEHKAASKKIKAEAQRQKRLLQKANNLSNEDLLEIFRQRNENRERVLAKAKASAQEAAKSSAATG